jgi:peptide/nickel transport system substrate-binding protein
VSRRLLAALLAILGAAGASCGRAPVPAPGPAKLAIPTPILSLDPTLSEATTISVLSNVFEPLVAHDRQLQVIPALATRWSTPDETTWVFSLRPGVLFHDGTPLDSAAVVAALERARNGPDSAVRGALWAVAKVETAGALAVRIRTSVPDALLLHELALVLVARGASRTEVEEKPVGTGPYRVVSWDRRGSLALAAWEKHWAGPPAITSVLVAPLAEGVDAARAAGRGEIDVVEVPISAARGTAPAGARFVTSPGLSTQYLWMNGPAVTAGVPNPFFDVRVRRAVALAVDRPRLALEATGSGGTAAPQVVPPTVVGHVTGLPAPAFDPAAARALLAGAGHRLPLAASLTYRSDPTAESVARLLKEMLDAAGFRVKLRPVPASDLFVEMREGRSGLVLAGWIFDAPDTGGFFRDCVRSRREGGTAGVFNPGYVNPEVDRLVDASHSVLASSARLDLLETAIRIVTDEAPLVPLYHQPDAWALSSRLEWTPRLDRNLVASEMRFAGGGR